MTGAMRQIGRYDPDGRCPKCGAKSPSVKWHPEAHDVPPPGETGCPGMGEHMMVTCACGWTEVTLPFDATIDQPGRMGFRPL